MRFFYRVIWAAVLLILAGGLAAAAPARGQSGTGSTLVLDERDASGLAWLQAAGAARLADYGAYSLWELPAGSSPRLAAAPSGLRVVETRIDFRGLTLDGSASQPEPALAPGLQSAPARAGVERLWVLQFAGPPQDAWLDELRQGGQTIVSCFKGPACLLWGPPAPDAVQRLGRLARWQGEFHPAYRLHPELRPGGALAGGGEVEVTVQLVDVPEAQAALAELAGLAARFDVPGRVLNYLNVRARLSAGQLQAAAALAPVVNIEPYHAPKLNDELQAQILTGLVSTNGVKSGDYQAYLDWLAAAGLPTDPAAYPIVDIVDDGIDQGDASAVLHPDFYELGSLGNPDRISYLQSCVSGTPANGVGGHGNLNAGIVGGYNNLSGFPYAETSGSFVDFRYGLGVSPYGRLAGTKVFTDLGYWNIGSCPSGGEYTGIVQRIYAAGARISTNSWGDGYYLTRGEYDAGAQEYDALVRDSDLTTPGNQEMLHIFSAGNDGVSGAGTIGLPGTAKNVLTVGATDFPRMGGSAENLAWYSSKGPTDDGRVKPDLVAPGSRIMGPASQDPDYDGNGVSVLYYPLSQTLYTYSYGTSHSTPAVAGAAQLVYADYAAAHGAPPSPAMLKAVLMNHARYLNGIGTAGNLPSNSQGWGMPDLERTFSGFQALSVDQTILFDEVYEYRQWNLTLPADSAGDLRATLVWTDAPGAVYADPALVNDLDLEVIVDGVTYLGNVFTNGYSTTGGAEDLLNNVESVFLPPGQYQDVTIRVTAWVLGGDGVPAIGDTTDQDFALVVTALPGSVLYMPLISR